MIHFKNNIKVNIVCKQFLPRVGIKTLIRQLGIEPEYFETKNITDIDFHQNTKFDYLIIHYKLLEKPKKKHITDIILQFKGKVLVIGEDKTPVDFHEYLILPDDSKEKTIEKIATFFSTIISEEQEEDNILSAREIDILKEVARGYSNKEIADKLFISINTVITHRKNLTEKLGIKTISGLTVYALMNDLINPEDVTT